MKTSTPQTLIPPLDLGFTRGHGLYSFYSVALIKKPKGVEMRGVMDKPITIAVHSWGRTEQPRGQRQTQSWEELFVQRVDTNMSCSFPRGQTGMVERMCAVNRQTSNTHRNAYRQRRFLSASLLHCRASLWQLKRNKRGTA